MRDAKARLLHVETGWRGCGTMAKNKSISVREVVADIKIGMTDKELMAKYMLSADGLQNIKNELVTAGFLTQAQLDSKGRPTRDTPQVDKKALVKKIVDVVKSGLPDNEIAKKFGISTSKLTVLLDSLIKAGYLSRDDLIKRPRKFE